ncbi:MAG: methyltransferase protein [Chloroflexi bacterium]|jgi:ubiquinone/menaquinone biosynthesis C-methylase UbiE|nr:methyltransferase protein [Chloroflexota bacterium]
MTDPGIHDIRDIRLFSMVDRAPDPSLLVRFVDLANTMPEIRAAKAAMLDALAVRDGATVLDVGCGTGDDARELARLVGPEGRAVGVDASETMIAEARRRAHGSGLHVDFEVTDAQHLPFPDDTFDACRTERMLSHVADPRAALAEMARVTRPGGRVCALDVDLDSAGLEDRVTRALRESMAHHVRSPHIGGELARLFEDVGMVDVAVRRQGIAFDMEMVRPLISSQVARLQDEGLVAGEETRRWWAAIEEARRADRPFLRMTAVIVSGVPRRT